MLINGSKAIGERVIDIVGKDIFGSLKIQNDHGVSSRIMVEANSLLSHSKKEFIGSVSNVGYLVENNPVVESSSCGKPNAKENGEFSGLVKVLSDLRPIVKGASSFQVKLGKFEL